MLHEDGANGANAFRGKYKTTFLCIKYAFVGVTSEYIRVVLIGDFDVPGFDW
jgi:hypothetical protein